MKTSTYLLLAILAGGAMFGQSVFGQTSDCASLTHRALELSGFNQSLDQVSEVADSQSLRAQLSGTRHDEEVAATLRPIIKKNLDGELLRKEVESRLAAHCSVEQMTRTIERLQSPLVARMLVLEAGANSPEGREKTLRYARVVSIAPPPDDRVDLVETLDVNSGETESATELTLSVIRGMWKGAGVDPQILAEMEQHTKELKAQVHRAFQIAMLATYRNATSADLQQYAKERGSEPLKGFYGQVNHVFEQVVEEQAETIGREMKTAMAQKAASPEKNP